MKTPPLAVAVLVAGMLPLPASEEQAAPEVRFEPLSLTVSKFKRDRFGKGTNPFRMEMNAVSGVSLTARFSMDPEWSARLVPDACTLKRLTDDRQTDLLDEADRKPDSFWEENRPLSLISTPEKDGFGAIIRGTKVPSAGAKKLLIEGELVFAPKGSEKDARHDGFDLQNNEVVDMEAVQLKFSRPTPRPGAPAAAGRDQDLWYVQVLPRKDVTNVKLLLFGKDEDVPILGGSGGTTRVMQSGGKAGGGDNPFQGVAMQGFSCPGGELSRIVVRYTPLENLVTLPFKSETGLDLGGATPDGDR